MTQYFVDWSQTSDPSASTTQSTEITARAIILDLKTQFYLATWKDNITTFSVFIYLPVVIEPRKVQGMYLILILDPSRKNSS